MEESTNQNTANAPEKGLNVPPNQEIKKEGKEDDPIRITIILPTNAYFMSGIRDFTLEMVKNMTGFSEQWAFRFQSVVDELCNNAIEFGSVKGADIRVTFIGKANEYLEIFVEDTGTKNPISPENLANKIKEKQQVNVMDQLKSLRGRGLSQIVSNWTDVLEFKKSELGGICVHVVKYLEKDISEKDVPGLNTSREKTYAV